MKKNGFTLIELLSVIGVVGILAAALGFSFVGWKGRYKFESLTKEVQIDLQKARARAMQRKRMHFMTLDSATQYTIYEDTNPPPDGNRNLEIGAGMDEELATFPRIIDYDLSLNGAVPSGERIDFDQTGLVSPNRTICIFSDLDGDGMSDYHPDEDCIVIFMTRISAGKLKPGKQAPGDCNADNCDIK